MGREITKSRDARRDIDQITDRIAQDSVDAALRWYDSLDDFLKTIARAPGIGTSRAKLQRGLRSVPFGNYLVFFRKSRGGVQILRVIHGARRWQRILQGAE